MYKIITLERNFKSLKSKKLIVVLLHSGRGFLGSLAVKKKKSTCNAGHLGSTLQLRRYPGEGNGNYSRSLAWEIPQTKKPQRQTVHGVTRVGHNFALKTRVPVAGIRSEPELEQLLGFLFFSVSFYPCNAPPAPFTLNFLSGRIHPTHFGRVLPLTVKCGACDLRQACKPRASLDSVLVITCLHMTSRDSLSHPEPSVNYFFYSSYFFSLLKLAGKFPFPATREYWLRTSVSGLAYKKLTNCHSILTATKTRKTPRRSPILLGSREVRSQSKPLSSKLDTQTGGCKELQLAMLGIHRNPAKTSIGRNTGFLFLIHIMSSFK